MIKVQNISFEYWDFEFVWLLDLGFGVWLLLFI
jgi:hypothetical protein